MRAAFNRIGKYELIAFAIGFALMAYELAASRILAPAIGSSTYIWTSVIGVIIAALSLGYAAGGIVADKRARQSDLTWLLLLSALGVIATLIFADETLRIISGSGLDARVQGLLSSLFLFMPTSFLLGMISPYLAKLRTTSLERTGRSIAGLSAFNAVGGIVGTFAVGFIFFGYIGTKETLVVVALLLIATSWIVLPSYRWKKRALVSFLVIMAGLLQLGPLPPGIIADIDTPTSRYRIYEGTHNNENVRMLVTGPGSAQSGVSTEKPGELVFDYTKQMAELVSLAPKKDSILMLGGGAFTIPAYLGETYPDTQIDVVEIDPKLKSIAKQYFGYRDRANVTIIDADARSYLQHNAKHYDIILTDVYNDLSIPFSLATVEYASQLKRSLSSGGAVITNIVAADSPACAPYLRGLHASHTNAFPHYKLYPQGLADLQDRQNIIIAYSNTPQTWLPETGSQEYQLKPAKAFTDNFAPVERLIHQCEA